MTTDQFAEKLKSKYPAYKNVDNATLVKQTLEKYPQYKSQINDQPQEKLSVAGQIFKPFLETGVQAYNTLATLGDVITGKQKLVSTDQLKKEVEQRGNDLKKQVDAMTPEELAKYGINNEQDKEDVIHAQLRNELSQASSGQLNKVRDLGIFGNVGSVNKIKTDYTAEDIKSPVKSVLKETGKEMAKSIGTGAEIGSNIAGGGAVKTSTRIASNAVTGFLAGAGREITDSGSVDANTLLEGVKNGVYNVVGGEIINGVGKAIKGGMQKLKQAGLDSEIPQFTVKKIWQETIDNTPFSIENADNGIKSLNNKIKTLNEKLTASAGDENKVSTITNQIQKLENKVAKESTKVLKQSSPLVKEALNAGIDEPTTKFISELAPTDKSKAKQMLQIAENASKNKAFQGNPRDVVGKSIMDRVDIINKAKTSSGKKIDEIINSVPETTKIDINNAKNKFITDLHDNGITLVPNENGGLSLNFADSSIISPQSQTYLQDAFDHLYNTKISVKELKNLRSRMFEQLKLGKKQNMFSGKDEILLGNLRDDIATSLEESKIPQAKQLKQANKIYAETKSALTDFYQSLGKQGKKFTDKDYQTLKSGQISSRLLSNAGVDAEAMINKIDEIAKLNGYKLDDNLYNQVVMAQEIEKMLKIAPSRSLQGQVKTAVENAQLGKEALQIAGGDVTKAPGLIQKIVGKVTGEDNTKKIQAIKKLLSYDTRANFESPVYKVKVNKSIAPKK